MNILLTNDDGIDSKGLKILEKILLNYGNVYVFAPQHQQSGKACSINTFIGININKIDDRHYAVIGSPVDCVEAACAFFNHNIDLVVSGCNNGYNLSHDVMYSGTCGACIQASFSKIKSIAFSCFNSEYFYLLDKLVKPVLDFVFENNLLDTNYFLNVNFPKTDHVKGIKLTKIYEPVYETYTPLLVDSLENKYVIERKINKDYNFEDRDIVAIKNGYISITPLSQTIFKEEIYQNVLSKIK